MIKRLLLLEMLTLVLFVTACQPEVNEDVNTSLDDHTAYLLHSWELNTLIQTDETAQPGQLKDLDISRGAIVDASILTFDVDTYVASGVISQLTGTEGNWSLDDPLFPTKILMTSDGQSYELTLGQSILSFSNELLLLNTKRSCKDDSPTVSYTYTFVKQ